MRRLLSFVAPLALVLPAAAQAPCGAVPGVTVTVTPPVTSPGQTVELTLTNGSDQGLTLPSSCAAGAVFPDASCTAPAVKHFVCLTVLTGVPPGQSVTQRWDQTDDFELPVPPGTYSFSVLYFDETFTAHACCASVTIAPEPGAPFCFGDSGCPCGNEDPSGSAGCRNSTGSGATLSAAGSTSVAADDLALHATGCPPGESGLFFVGGAVFSPQFVGDGLACTGGVFRYFPGVTGPGGTFDLTGPVASAPAGLIQAGDTRHFQAWTRDVLCGPPPAPCPSPCGNNSNLTNGYTVLFTP
jgi:hypothetical protein